MIDFSAVPILDSTAAATVEGFVRKARRQGATVYVAGALPSIRRMLLAQGVRPPQVRYRTKLADAVESARRHIAAADQLAPEIGRLSGAPG